LELKTNTQLPNPPSKQILNVKVKGNVKVRLRRQRRFSYFCAKYKISEMSRSGVLLIDHRDSFTRNVAELVRKVSGSFPQIIDYQDITPTTFHSFSRIILSPGPGLPQEFPSSEIVLKHLRKGQKVLGICLGHQAIARYYGGKLEQMAFPMHGRDLQVKIRSHEHLFQGMPPVFRAGFYHSWKVSALPPELMLTATDENGNIAAFRHVTKPVFGVQFHPESFLTPTGSILIQNFLA